MLLSVPDSSSVESGGEGTHGGAGSPAVADKTASDRGHYDPTDPKAGKSGWVLPESKQFKPGDPGGPGRPRGAWPRAALARKLAKDWELDEDEPDPDRRIGKKAREVADAMMQAALMGDTHTVNACAEIINQVEGKPIEFKQVNGSQARTLIVNKTADGPPPELPSAGDGTHG